LKEKGMKCYKKTPKFILTPKAVIKRKRWAKLMLGILSEIDFANVAWSDESLIKWDPYFDMLSN
jgi:hypothetical protein